MLIISFCLHSYWFYLVRLNRFSLDLDYGVFTILFVFKGKRDVRSHLVLVSQVVPKVTLKRSDSFEGHEEAVRTLVEAVNESRKFEASAGKQQHIPGKNSDED